MADIFEVFLTFFIIVVALVAVILFIACGKSVVFLNEISCITSRSNATPKLGKVAHARQSSQKRYIANSRTYILCTKLNYRIL